MKANLMLVFFYFVLATYLQAQNGGARRTSPQTNSTTVALQNPLTPLITERGPNYRVWTRTNSSSNSATKHRVVELATGMHYWDGQQWIVSDPSFQIISNGFSATHTQHKVRLNQEINVVGAVNVITRDGVVLHSTPLGIGLYDAASGNFLLIGQTTNSKGVQIANNKVLYPNAFNGVCADVLYTMEQGAFHQDVVFTGQVDPAAYGFPVDTTRIQILTEFYNLPTPEVRQSVLHTEKNSSLRTKMASPDLLDQTLGFGEFVMGHGHAYLTSTNAFANGLPQRGAPVGKALFSVNGRKLLVESVEYSFVSNQLRMLPNCNGGIRTNAQLNIRKVESAYAMLPVIPAAAQSASAAAKAPPVKKYSSSSGHPQAQGFVMDYVATVGGSMDDDFTFQGDTTYFIDGYFNCNGNVTFKGGAVLKYPAETLPGSIVENASALTVSGSVYCQGSSYRPTVFTATDDDTIGDTMSGIDTNYTGIPGSNPIALSSYYGEEYLILQPQSLSNIRFCFSAEALGGNDTPPASAVAWNNLQFVNCQNAYYNFQASDGITPISLNNCLMANVQNPFITFYVAQIYYLNQCTFDQDQVFDEEVLAESADSFFVTNSIFSNTQDDWTTYSITGDFNGFYNNAYLETFGNDPTVITNSPFQSSGAANYYLAPSTFQSLGTTDLDSRLLAELGKRTTYPPAVIASSNINFNLTLSQVVPRDINWSLDLGYHYAAIDYALGADAVSNATLTISPDTVVAGFDTNASGFSLAIDGGGQLLSQGGPTTPILLVDYRTVQEEYTNCWTKPSLGLLLPNWLTENTGSNIICQFNDFSIIANDTALLYGLVTNLGPISFQNCQFQGGSLASTNPTISLSNCLFESVDVTISANDGLAPQILNCLFWAGSLNVEFTNTNGLIQNNLFDQTSIIDAGNTNYIGGYNGYETNYDHLTLTNATDVFLTNSLGYERGRLGHFYQPTNSPLLNVGSTNANLLGLYHYTTQTNQVEQRDSTVDIGYHYVALNSSGQPIDANSNGIPDYLENPYGPVPTIIYVQPESQTVDVYSNVTFSVVASGEGILTYQWAFGGTNITAATNSDFTIDSVQSSNAGNYAVEIGSLAGTTNSTYAVLTVVTPSVATPVINPNGPYLNVLAITITCATEGASIYYTSNGIDPTTNDIPTTSGAMISITNGETIKAKAFREYWTSSSVATQQFYQANVQVAAGASHGLALMPDTTVVSWGDNTYGQLGQGMTGPFGNVGGTNQPYPVPGLTNVVAIAASYLSSLALESNGTVWWWGEYPFEPIPGQQTFNTGMGNPTQVEGLSNIVAIALYDEEGMAVDTNGSVWYWGLGTGSGEAGQWPPAQLEGLSNVVAVAIGNPTRLALTTNGNVYTWTAEWSGTPDSSELQQVTNLTNITAICVADFSHSMALRSDGTVWTWGYNDDGQLGDGTTTDRACPIQVPSLTNIVAISGNAYLFPPTGGGTSIERISNNIRHLCSDLSRYDAHSLALRVDGAIFAWGANDFGQLGDGTDDDSYSPVQVLDVTNAIAIAAGPNYSLAIGADLWAYEWGTNAGGLSGLDSENDAPGQFRIFNVGDPDGDGIPTWLELLDGTDPYDYYNGALPTLTKIGGDDQFGPPGTYLVTPLSLLVTNTSGQPLSNAPVTITVSTGDAGVSSNLDGLTNQTLTLRATSNGIIQFYVTFSPNALVTNTITATAASESATNVPDYVTVTFTTTSLDLDSDYDSISDSQEIADGTDPNDPTSYVLERLSYWDFDLTSGIGDTGQLPVNDIVLSLLSDFETNCVQIGATNALPLTYHDVERDSAANINLRHGTIRFWFQPNWETTPYASLFCEGPGSAARFIEMGQETTNASYGWWGLTISPDGSQINFGAQSNGVGTNYLSCNVTFASNQWHQIALTYGPSNSVLYVDGQLAATGAAVSMWPDLQVRASGGFTVGSDWAGNRGVAGQLDDLEIFNYPITATNIGTDYLSALAAFVPGAPTNLTFEILSATAVSLSWNAGGSTNQNSFLIEKSVGTNGTFLEIAQVPANQYNYVDYNMLIGVPNLYRVRAHNVGGLSDPSNVVNTYLDTDGDGLSDFVKQEFGLNTSITDNDGDGLPDAWEILYGLNPTSATGDDGASGDPNHDGTSNLVHYETGTNPTANTLQGTNTVINLIVYQPEQ